MRFSDLRRRPALIGVIAGAALFVGGIAWLIRGASIGAAPLGSERVLTSSDGAPWILGQPRARFAFVVYADLKCPYCREYLPALRRLVAEHPEANLQWRHLPLAEHEPAAHQAARVAECAGEIGGGTAFWTAVDWLYRHPSSDDSKLPDSISSPQMTSHVQACLRSTRPDAIISHDMAEAKRDQVSATPTLRVLDRDSGRSLILQGVLAPDALLSAMDLLASPTSEIDAK